MNMHDPARPGDLYLKPLGLTVTAAADALGVTRKALSDLVNGHSGISTDMAIGLEKVGWSEADFWLQMQLNVNLWKARQHCDSIKIRRTLSIPAIT